MCLRRMGGRRGPGHAAERNGRCVLASTKRLLVVEQEIAALEGLDPWEVGPVIKAAFVTVRTAVGAGQPVTLGKLIRVVPRPDKPDQVRMALVARPAAALLDVVTGTRVEAPIAGGWRPDAAVSAAEVIRVVVKHTGEAKQTVAKVLHGLEEVVGDTVASGVQVTLTELLAFHPHADRSIRPQTRALVSVKLGPRLSSVAKALELEAKASPSPPYGRPRPLQP
jgi:nucleoid DNA-binding protein